jgi:exocyst complex component 2
MTVVRDLDKSLFECYIKPKTTVVIEILHDGILNMDWYETPQPTGIYHHTLIVILGLTSCHRNSTIHV